MLKKGDMEELEQARGNLTKQLEQLVGATGYLLEPLRNLKEDQVGAVVMLSLLTSEVTSARILLPKTGKTLVNRFKRELVEVCPEFERMIRTDTCFDATVSYLGALKKCEEEGRSDANCPEAWGIAGLTIGCISRRLENDRRIIVDILKGQKPPRRIPWQT